MEISIHKLAFHKYTSDCHTPEILEWANEEGVYYRDIKCPGHLVHQHSWKRVAANLLQCEHCLDTHYD